MYLLEIVSKPMAECQHHHKMYSKELCTAMPRKRTPPEEKIKALDAKLDKIKKEEEAIKAKAKEKRQQILAQKKNEEGKIREQKRKDEANRLCMKANLLEKHMEANPEHHVTVFMNKLFDEYITRPRDRILCDLPPRPPTKNDNPEA